MKVVQSVLLAVALLSPAALFSAPVSNADQYSVLADHQDLIEGADAFAYAARESLQKLQSLKSPNSDVNTGIRLSREIQLGALELVELIDNGASQSSLVNQLLSLEEAVLRLDQTKRKLLLRYNDPELNKTLTYVRTTYFYLKQLLTGEV